MRPSPHPGLGPRARFHACLLAAALLALAGGLASVGAESFPVGRKIPVPAGLSPYGVAVGDLDGDGRPDMVVSDFSLDSMSVIVSTPTGRFARTKVYAT